MQKFYSYFFSSESKSPLAPPPQVEQALPHRIVITIQELEDFRNKTLDIFKAQKVGDPEKFVRGSNICVNFIEDLNVISTDKQLVFYLGFAIHIDGFNCGADNNRLNCFMNEFVKLELFNKVFNAPLPGNIKDTLEQMSQLYINSDQRCQEIPHRVDIADEEIEEFAAELRNPLTKEKQVIPEKVERTIQIFIDFIKDYNITLGKPGNDCTKALFYSLIYHLYAFSFDDIFTCSNFLKDNLVHSKLYQKVVGEPGSQQLDEAIANSIKWLAQQNSKEESEAVASLSL